MGSISRVHFSRYKALLKLSDEAWEIADRHDVIERKLRYVIGLEETAHVELLRQIIDFGLTSKQVKQIVETGSVEEDKPDEVQSISRLAVRFAKSVKDSSKTTGLELAQALLLQENDVTIALARIQTMRSLLDDAEQTLTKSENVTHG
jgi:hypothetical protein